MRTVTMSANRRLLRGGSTAMSMVASSGSGMVPKKPRGRVMGRGSSGGRASPGSGREAMGRGSAGPASGLVSGPASRGAGSVEEGSREKRLKRGASGSGIGPELPREKSDVSDLWAGSSATDRRGVSAAVSLWRSDLKRARAEVGAELLPEDGSDRSGSLRIGSVSAGVGRRGLGRRGSTSTGSVRSGWPGLDSRWSRVGSSLVEVVRSVRAARRSERSGSGVPDSSSGSIRLMR